MATEHTNYSHVAIKMVDSETNQTVYYQSSHTVVNCMSEAMFLSQESIMDSFDFQVDDSIKIAAKTFGIESLGLPYGVLSCVGLAIVQIASYVGIKMDNPFRDEGQTYVCSEFIATLLSKVDSLNVGMPLDDVRPVDLYPLVQQLPKIWSAVK